MISKWEIQTKKLYEFSFGDHYYSLVSDDSIENSCRNGDKIAAKFVQVKEKVHVIKGEYCKHLHSPGNLVEGYICMDDILALGEEFNDVLVLGKNTDNLIVRSTTDDTYDVRDLGEQMHDSLVLSEEWYFYLH